MAMSRSMLVVAFAYIAVFASAVRVADKSKPEAFNPAVSAVESEPAKPLVWCAAVSGNGGNWASTIGFLAEALNVFLDQSVPRGSQVDLRCVAGGSSGSATSLLVRNLITNQNLGIEKNGKVSVEHARIIAKSMSFLAMAVDLSEGALAKSVGQIAREYVGWAMGGKKWDKSPIAVGTEGSKLQFKHGLVVSKFMGKEWLELKAADMITNRHCGLVPRPPWMCDFTMQKLRGVADKFGIVNVVDLPELGGDVTALEQEQLMLILGDVASHVKALALKFVGGGLAGMIKGASMAGMIEGQKPLLDRFDDVMQEDVGDGVIAVTFASFQDAQYSTLRVLALMSRATAEAILLSPDYRESLLACDGYQIPDGNKSTCMHANRHILAVVESADPMLKLSTMEPHFQEPYVKRFVDMGVVSIFDPADLQRGEPSWTLTAVPKDEEWNGERKDYYYILGGFVDRGQTVSLLKYYRQGLGDEEQTSYALFGKSSDPMTAVKGIKEELTHNDEGAAEASWADYKSWGSFRPLTTPPNIVVDGYCNWDCNASLPANLRGASWKLRLHGAAVARTASHGKSIFDPMDGCESE